MENEGPVEKAAFHQGLHCLYYNTKLSSQVFLKNIFVFSVPTHQFQFG